MPEYTPPTRDYPLGSTVPAAITWPLTADNLDTDGLNPLVTLPVNPAPFGPNGLIGNGVNGAGNAKAVAALPAWAASSTADLSLFAIGKASGPSQIWRELVVSVCQDIGNDKCKLELAVVDDAVTTLGDWVLRCSNGVTTSLQKILCRVGWRFEFRTPEMVSSVPRPQALCWLDSSTLLLCSDIAGTSKCVLYRIDAATGEYTGRASSTTYRHPNGLHVDPDGGVWCVCSVGGFDKRKRIDLTASFSSGAITESGDWNTGDVPTSSIAFATLGGVEYVLLSQYATSGTPRCYVFLRSQMAGTVNQTDRVISFRVGFGVQDLVQRASDGLVYASRSAGSGGLVQAYDLAAIIAAGVDDVTPTPVSVYPAATAWPEGLDFHPVTDRLWMCTEGLGTAGDSWSHSSVWSTAMTGSEENSFLVDYTRGEIQVRLNGRLQWQFDHSFASLPAPTHITIGAAVGAAPPLAAFMSAGVFVRNVAISSVPFTPTQLVALEST